MTQFFNLLLVIFFLSGTTPAIGDILFYDNCENYPGTEWGVQGSTSPNSFSVSAEQARTGRKSYKMVMRRYGTSGADVRVEVVLRADTSPPIRNFKYNTEYWLGWSVFIPSDYDFPTEGNNWSLMGQFHGSPDSCETWRNPIIALFSDGSAEGYQVVVRSQAAKCGTKNYDRYVSYQTSPLLRGEWNDVVMNVKFSNDNTGFTKVWLNKNLVCDDKGANAFNDDVSPYFKLGMYGHVDKDTVLYYDEIRVGGPNSSYSEVSPSSGATAAETNSNSKGGVLSAPSLSILNGTN